jgi:hypothetical protein
MQKKEREKKAREQRRKRGRRRKKKGGKFAREFLLGDARHLRLVVHWKNEIPVFSHPKP